MASKHDSPSSILKRANGAPVLISRRDGDTERLAQGGGNALKTLVVPFARFGGGGAVHEVSGRVTAPDGNRVAGRAVIHRDGIHPTGK